MSKKFGKKSVKKNNFNNQMGLCKRSIIDVVNRQKALPISKKNIRAIVRAILELEEQEIDEVSIHFVDTLTISKLHEQFFDDPSTTDCISFPFDDQNEPGYRFLGEIFVCPATAVDYAQKNGTEPYQETLLYIVHGLLHLFGYDDLDPPLKRQMRRAEKKHMANLQQQGLIPY